MPIEKPLPLMVGNKAYYSLTSYDPVEITVEVPYTSDEDIQYGLQMTVADMGGSPENLDDPAWLAEHFDGMTSKEQVYEAMRQQMVAMGAQIAEQQKVSKCIDALSTRLCQSIPPQHLEDARQMVRMSFTQQLQDEGMTPEQFVMRSGTTMAQLEAMFDRQARHMAEGDAALSAYAHEKKLKVDEHEFGRLLGIPAEQVDEVIQRTRAVGQYDEMREAALRSKAAQIVVAECSCNYVHETPEQARTRMAQYRQMEQMYSQRFDDADEGDGAKTNEGGTGFKLV